MLAALLILLMVLGVFTNAVWFFGQSYYLDTPTLVTDFIVYTGLFGAYFLSRTPYHGQSALLTTTIISLACFIGVASEPGIDLNVAFLSLSSLMAVALLPMRQATILVGGNTIGTFLLPLFVPGWNYVKIASGLTFLIIATALIGVIIVMRRWDLARIEQQAQALIQAQQTQLQLALEQHRMEVLSTFITSASHEFRTPLSIVNTNAYLMAKTDDQAKREHLARVVRDQVGYVDQLVEGLNTLASLDRETVVKTLPVQINVVAQQIYTRMQSRMMNQGIAFTLVLGPDLPPMCGDLRQLCEAVRCIVDNALRYTPRGGSVTMVTRAAAGTVLLEVIDSGIGIALADLPHVFDRFYRADSAHSTRGLGLGLSIAQKIVETHQGRIEVESTLNVGSTFRLVFPVVEGCQLIGAP